MSSQIRYRTLVDHLARIYDATKETRTGRLQEGLTRVLAVIDPKGAEGWGFVKADSQRLLRVWLAREDCPGAAEFAAQILGSLTDFAEAEETVPHLVISERPAPVVIKPDPAERIAAHRPIPAAVEKDMTQSEAAAIEAVLAVAIAAEKEEEEEEEEEEVEVEEEEDEDEDEDEESVVEVEPEVAAAPAEDEDEEEEAEDTEEEEEEAETETTPEVAAEVVEPEADSETEEDEDEEEEGVEVEKRTIRGREYWLASDGTLYAVTEDDEIGDEVGRVTKEGRPVFLAPK